MSVLRLADLLEPIDGDECCDESAFRHWIEFRDSLGWVAGEIERLVGFCKVAPVTFCGRRGFDVGVEGSDTELSIIIGALAQREVLLDAVAWPLGHPDRWATLLSRLPSLGWAALLAHPAEPFAKSLKVFRTPLTWLMSGGDGIAPLNLEGTAGAIRDASEAGGSIRFEDDAHAAEMAAAVRALTTFDGFVVDDNRRAA